MVAPERRDLTRDRPDLADRQVGRLPDRHPLRLEGVDELAQQQAAVPGFLGPIVDPGYRALILTAVAPHMLFDRSLVLAPESAIRVEVLPDRPSELAVDGVEAAQLEPGDTIVCTASPIPARLVTFGRRDFHGILKSKFGLNER